MPQPKKSPLDQVLIVEGQNDQHVIWALCAQHKLPKTFEVSLAGENTGKEAVLADFPIQLKNPKWKTVAIVIDADQDTAASWQAVYARLIAAGYTKVKKDLPKSGLILESEESDEKYLPRFGAWLMPDNQSTGILEDFIRQLIPENDPLKPEADRILNEIESSKIQQYAAKDRAKAFIHTWLAWQESPGRPMGQTITAKVLQKDAPIAASFTHWLRKLFLTTG
jgi:hypothetical protein